MSNAATVPVGPLLDEYGLRILPGNQTGWVDATVSLELRVSLNPGTWVVTRGGLEYAVTSLQLRISGDHLHITQPKGVARRRNGRWSRTEQLLFGAVPPRDPRTAWTALPDHVQLLVRRAYTDAVQSLPAFDDVPGLTT